jgi:protein NrfD
MDQITTTRSNPLIDPGLHVWHGEVAGYLFLGGLVAGVMVLMGLSLLARDESGRSRSLGLLPWTAPILLSVGMLFLWLDLENPWNAFRFYVVFRPTSPMSWGAWILLAIYPASIALAWRTTPQVDRERIGRWLEARWPTGARWIERGGTWLDERNTMVSAANVLGGIALGIYTGMLLGTMASRPLWNSAILGPLFLVSGLSTGAAYLLLFRISREERVLFARADMAFMAVELALLAVWLIGLTSGGASHRAAAATVLGGPYTTAFWTLVVGLGLLVPLVGDWLEQRGGHVPGRVAPGLVLIGGFALRWILVMAGQHAGWNDVLAAL